MQDVRTKVTKPLHQIACWHTNVVVGVNSAGEGREFHKRDGSRSRIGHSRANDDDVITASLQPTNEIQRSPDDAVNFGEEHLSYDRDSHQPTPFGTPESPAQTPGDACDGFRATAMAMLW